MYSFLEQNSLYVVLTIVLVTWIGLFGHLIKIETRIRKIEKKIIQEVK